MLSHNTIQRIAFKYSEKSAPLAQALYDLGQGFVLARIIAQNGIDISKNIDIKALFSLGNTVIYGVVSSKKGYLVIREVYRISEDGFLTLLIPNSTIPYIVGLFTKY